MLRNWLQSGSFCRLETMDNSIRAHTFRTATPSSYREYSVCNDSDLEYG